MVWYGMERLRYGKIRYGMVWYGTVRYGLERFVMVRYGTERYGLVPNGYRTVPFGTEQMQRVPWDQKV
jgi:hypothetical protein